MTTNKLTEKEYKRIVNTPAKSAEEWNRLYQPGMAVTLVLDDGTTLETTTRSEAWEIADGVAIVKVEGKAGGYRLNRVLPKDPPATAQTD